MGCGRVCVLVTTVMVCALAYFLYVPVYDGYSDTSAIRKILVSFKVLRTICWLGESAGYGSALNISRQFGRLSHSEDFVPDKGGVVSTDAVFDGIPVRIYRPADIDGIIPALVFYHGGGWSTGSVDMSDAMVRELAVGTAAMVLSVEYRLAPEHKFPVPLEDCVKATVHVLKNAQQLGVDSNKIAIIGESAGGNLAAAVALKFRDMTELIQPRAQMLLYPGLQAYDLRLPSIQQNKHDIILNARDLAFAWANYAEGHGENVEKYLKNEHVSPDILAQLTNDHLSHEYIPEKLRYLPYIPPPAASAIKADPEVWQHIKHVLQNPLFNPLIAEDLSGLPVAYIVTAQNDVQRDDGFLYARRLSQAGVKVIHHHQDIAFHAAGLSFATLLADEVTELNDMRTSIHAAIKHMLTI